MNRFFASAVLLAFAAACSKEQTVNSSQTQSPSEPKGAIVGVVTSMTTGLPIPGASVSVPSPTGIFSVPTDAGGAYLLGGLPAGATYQVRFSAPGYVAAFGSAAIPASAGDFPANGIAQVDAVLPEANATLNGHVYERDGLPAEGVVLMVDLRNRGFDFVATATSGTGGAYTLSGLPGAPTGMTIAVVAQPWDSNGDQLADYDSVSQSVMTYPGARSLLDFDLRVAPAELLLLTSNLESGTLDPAAQIVLTFNRELDAALTTVSLSDSTAARTVAIETSLDTTSKILTVFPTGGTTLASNHLYSLTIQARARNGDVLNTSRTFTTDVAVSLLPPVSGLKVTPTVVDHDTTSFSLLWDANLEASGYQVWVRDSGRNPSYLLMRTVAASFAPSTTVTLPATFDYYTGDAMQTPFAFSVRVDFVVVAVNAAGDAPSPAAVSPTSRTDTVAPSVTSVLQSGSADNSGGSSPKTITLAVYFDEYMAKSATPTITLPAGETYTFAWDPYGMSGVFTITIPALTDGQGSYTISGARDSSGNAMADRSGTLTATLYETEPNNTIATANGPFTATFTIGGSTTSGDPDYFAVTNTSAFSRMFYFETFEGVVGSCPTSDTVVYLVNASGATLLWDDDSGVNLCSYISYSVPASTTYYVRVQPYSLSANYLLRVTML